ncbi:MAG: ATP-dependent protease, Lon family [Candidatus Eremiobacteraeota bacterium]|nr:ATP-dependent protease, Lon family [Candidatus Eremiobacteraeota bacterium]
MAQGADQAYVARFRRKYGGDDGVRRYVGALYEVLATTIGSDKMVLRAGKLNALKMMRSNLIPERILALQRLVFEDPTLDRLPQPGKYLDAIAEIEDGLANLVAQRTVEEKIESKVNLKMAERHQEYLKDLKLEAIREDGGPETPATQKKLEELVALDGRKLSASALQLLRPASLGDVVGQKSAIGSLLAKISSPFPQHVILYGPPGVGKTTVARLALEVAKTRGYTPFAADAPFVEASGAPLRWDPRETTNPLLGSVHDPIYQGSRREFAEGGIPEPKLGLVTKAHGGVLFIDELGEMDAVLQTKLLKVLEDKRFTFESSYYDPTDPSVPAYVKKLFDDGAPADFILIGATTRDPSEIDPAIRSRCAEVFFEPLTESQIREIVLGAAKRLGVKLARRVPDLIASYTIEGRKAVQIVADAHGHALFRERAGTAKAGTSQKPITIVEDDVTTVVQTGRLVPHTPVRARRGREIGKTYGLAVAHHVGSIIEVEAVAFPAHEARKGSVRFNDTAGSMAKDSVFNATSVIRAVASVDPQDFDLHVNVVGGGNIDGPSAGLAVFLALYSALTRTPLPRAVALTGELSIAGRVRPVGGIVEKLYAARQAGMRLVLVPLENARDVDRSIGGIEIVTVSTVHDALEALGIAPLAPPMPLRRVRAASARR